MSRASAPAAERRLLAAACVLLAIPLAAHAYAALGARYVGDDYCAAYLFRDHGFFGGQRWLYMNWGAEPTTVFLMAATDSSRPAVTGIWPGLAVVVWVGVSAWAIRELLAGVAAPAGRLVPLLLAELIVFATIQDTPNVIQSVYMRVPMLAYLGPLTAAAAYAGALAVLARRRAAGAGGLAASAAIAFVAGAFSPVYVALQTTALALAWLARRVMPREDRALDRLLLAGAAGSIAALAVIVVAPGNAARQAFFPHPAGLAAIAKSSVLYSLFVFGRPLLPLLKPAIVAVAPAWLGGEPSWLPVALTLGASPLTLVLVLAVAAWLGGRAGSGIGPASSWLLWAVPAFAFVLVLSTMAPSAYGTSTPPPPRALIVPQFVIVCAAVVWGWIAGARWRARRGEGRAPAAALALTAISALLIGQAAASTLATVARGREMHAWAARWDDADRQLRAARAAGNATATVPAVGAIGGTSSITVEPGWVNGCAAEYYGLSSITGTP